MVTKEQALAARHGDTFHYIGAANCRRMTGPRGGITEQVTRARVTGNCKTWKRDTTRFRLPVKHGLYASGEITNGNAEHWHASNDCPINAS